MFQYESDPQKHDRSCRHITVLVEMSDQLREPNPDTHRVIGLDGEPASDSWLTISIRDSGSGLSSEERAKLFERFSRALDLPFRFLLTHDVVEAHPSKDQFTGGHGLGLYAMLKHWHLGRQSC